MVKEWGKIVVTSAIEQTEGIIDGIKFIVKEYPGTYYDPPEIEIEYIEGMDLLPEDEDEFVAFEEMLIDRLGIGQYEMTEDARVELKRYNDYMEEIMKDS